jgi:hypothetical protein
MPFCSATSPEGPGARLIFGASMQQLVMLSNTYLRTLRRNPGL